MVAGGGRDDAVPATGSSGRIRGAGSIAHPPRLPRGDVRRLPPSPACAYDPVVRVVLGSDERTAVTDAVVGDLAARGHEVVVMGPAGGEPGTWAEVGRAVGTAVASGDASTGVLFCWTGTGASIAANKVRGVRAALCTDAATAEGARRWNDANVLVMGLRLTSVDVAREMLDAWFEAVPDPSEADDIACLDD